MLNKFKFHIIKNSLLKFERFTIATQALRKKSIFEQTQANPYHIYPWRYSKRKTQEVLIDPNIQIPLEQSTAVKESGKHLISILEKEELKNIKNNDLKRDNFLVGDTIEVEYYMSLTSKKLNKYRGVVLEIKRPNSLTFSFKFLTLVSGEHALLEYPFYSPLLASVKLISKGKFGNKRKIFNIRNIGKMNYRMQEMLKGGRNVKFNKSDRQRIMKTESQKGAIVLD